MKCFTLYVKKKERELSELIVALSERSRKAGGKLEERVRYLETLTRSARENELKMDRQVLELKSKIHLWKEKAEAL